MNSITINLTDRQLALLDTLTGINVTVPKAVVNNSALHATERDQLGTKRADQKEEMADLLYIISEATRPAMRETECSICGETIWNHEDMDHAHVSRNELTRCYDGGASAARQGMNESDNPFTVSPEKKRAWSTGFRQAILR